MLAMFSIALRRRTCWDIGVSGMVKDKVLVLVLARIRSIV